MAECRSSPISKWYLQCWTSYPQTHYYQPGQQTYQRLPSVDSLPSSSGYYNSQNPVHMPHPNVYVRPIDRPSHPVPPGAYNPTDNVPIYPTNDDYMNGPSQDHYYPDPYSQPPLQQQSSNSPSLYNPHSQYGPLQTRQYTQQVMKQPIYQPRTPSLQRQVVYQQTMNPSQQNAQMQQGPIQHVYIQPQSQYAQSTGPSPTQSAHHVVSLYDGSLVDQRPQPQSPYNPSQMPPISNSYSTPNGTNNQKTEGVVTNATQSPIMSTAPAISQPNTIEPLQNEKPKKPPPKRNRKSAAQLKTEAAAKVELQNQMTTQQPPIEDLGLSQKQMNVKPNNEEHQDTSALLMPPPKVAQAPSVLAAAAKAMYSTTPPSNSNQSTPQKQDQSPQQFNQSSINSHESSQQSNTTPVIEQQTTTKRQRSASQRTQQQMARLQKQKEVELLKAREEREYLVKFVQLKRTVRALVFKNGALADEVSRLKMQIDICREERKMVAKRVQHYERNRIRRQQTQERKALARAVAAQQLEQKSTDTAEDDDNSRSMDVILPLNDLHSTQQYPRTLPTNFQSMAEPHSDAVFSVIESMQKARNASTTPRKRSRVSKNSDQSEHAPVKRRRSNGGSTSDSNNRASNQQQQLKLQIIRDEFMINLPRSHESSNSMDYSPVMAKQHQSILMSPVDEMQYSTMNRSEDSNQHLEVDRVERLEMLDTEAIEANEDDRKSPLKIQISEEPLQPDNSSSSTPTKTSAQLTPTGRKKSESVTSSGTAESLRKRISTRLQQQRQTTPPTPNEDIVSLRTRSASRSNPSNQSPKPGRTTPSSSNPILTNLNTTPSTSSSFSTSPSLLLNTSSTSIGFNTQSGPNLSPLPTRELYTRFPANFLEPSNTTPIDSPQSTTNEKMTEEPRESDFDRPLNEQQLAALKSDRHLRSNSSTTEGGSVVETRQRVNSRASRSRAPRHSLTPSSLADSETLSNSASPIPFASGDPNNPSNTPTVMTRRKAAEIATSSKTPMKTRSKFKLQGS